MATTTAKEIKVYEQNNIWVIKNVLTPEECKHYLDYSETIGYGDAPITVGKDQYVLVCNALHFLTLIDGRYSQQQTMHV